MNTRNRPGVAGRGRAGWVVAVAVAAMWSGDLRAQSPVAPSSGGVVPAVAVAPLGENPLNNLGGLPTRDPAVVQASYCPGCSGPSSPLGVSPGIHGYGKKYGPPLCDVGCDSCGGCGENGCVPGRPPCETCEGQCRIGRLFCAFHNALCCPDPCYEPRWMCGPNAALFVDPARPVTQTRFRWDAGRNLIQPDRSEYFWAAIGAKGPPNPETGVDYDELTLTQEIATERFSFYITVPYRSLNGDVNGGAGGFSDLAIGTKTLILDSELLQFTFQFQTNIPIGVAGRGIGVGHVSLIPSLLTALKLYPDTYFQQQLGYWIPISPTSVNGSSFAGGIFQFNHSLNHVLCRPLSDTALIGTIESVGYTFTAGRFTDPVTGLALPANQQTYFSVGPGLRLCVCDKVDFGFGVQFAVTNPRFADQLYRTEIRWRF